MSFDPIDNAIYAHPKGELHRELIACLRQGCAKRMPRSRGTDRRGQIPDMLSIHVRPPEIGDRLMPGHWEGDLIKGAGNKSAVAVLVERMSRAVCWPSCPTPARHRPWRPSRRSCNPSSPVAPNHDL
jgi:IS30 family transposase